jgi:hypothetical protein
MSKPSNSKKITGKRTAFPQDGLTRGVQISQGLDRLKFGLYVEFSSELLFDVLSDAKLESQQTRKLIPIKLGPDENYYYNCHPNGKSGGYSFHISRADVNIFISTRKDYMETPNVWVDIGSASCWSPGYNTVIEYVTKMIRIYTGKIHKNSVSEVHLCSDFIGLKIESLGIEQYKNWITRANKFHSYYDRFKFSGVSFDQTEGDLGFATETGVSIGQGDIALRIYDKVFEIERNNCKKSLFASVWGKDEFDESPVTRVEFQLRKTVLKQFRIKTLEQLFQKMNGLWSYCTTDWARYCKEPFDRENRHQDRAKIHEWWKKVQQLQWGTNTIVIRKKPLPLKDKNQLADMMIGCAMNLAAIDLCKFDNTDQITNYLMAEVDTWCRRKSQKIDPKTGLTELQEKMKQKINEVWPYGYCEVHGPTERDAERGSINSYEVLEFKPKDHDQSKKMYMKIYVWPDYSWCEDFEYNEMDYGWKGDDFTIIDVPNHIEDIDKYLEGTIPQGRKIAGTETFFFKKGQLYSKFWKQVKMPLPANDYSDRHQVIYADAKELSIKPVR